MPWRSSVSTPSKEPLLVADIVPCGIEPPGLEAVVVVAGSRRAPAATVLVDHADVDALVEADLEPAVADLVDARLPLLARLAEEIVVEQMEMLRIWLAAPDVGNGVDRARLALLLGHDAEPALEPAAALREADRAVEAADRSNSRSARLVLDPSMSLDGVDCRCSYVPPTMASGNSCGTAPPARR